MLAALPSCRAEMSSTPASTSAWEILKFAVPSKPKQRRAPNPARSFARTAATVELLLTPACRTCLTPQPTHNNIGNSKQMTRALSRQGRIIVMHKKFTLGLIAATIFCSSSFAQEITLRAVTAFAEKTTYSRGFEKFIDQVNAEGKGLVQINYIGGPKAMPPFEVGNALKTGVVDMANTTGAFTTNVMPESDAWKLTELPMSELRKNGGYDYMAKLYAEKMNAIFLARLVDNNPFHLYLNKPITGPDLTGLKIRITPVYRDFFQALGATVVQTPPGEVYTSLERGVVDGYGWPITGIFDLGWHEKTKYRVDPGFYTAEVSILVNKSTWDRLTDAQRNVLRKAGEQAEADAVATFAQENAKDIKRQADAGIQTIRLEGAEGKLYRDKAYEAGWAGVIRQSPQHGAKLKEFFAKAN